MNPITIRSFSKRGDFAPLHQAMNRLIQDVAWAPLSAGAEAEGVEVSFENGSLTVSGQLPQRDADQRWVLTELPQGRFQRRFSLKTPIDADRIEAKVNAGLLTLTLPKSEQVKPRKIAVKAG